MPIPSSFCSLVVLLPFLSRRPCLELSLNLVFTCTSSALLVGRLRSLAGCYLYRRLTHSITLVGRCSWLRLRARYFRCSMIVLSVLADVFKQCSPFAIVFHSLSAPVALAISTSAPERAEASCAQVRCARFAPCAHRAMLVYARSERKGNAARRGDSCPPVCLFVPVQLPVVNGLVPLYKCSM